MESPARGIMITWWRRFLSGLWVVVLAAFPPGALAAGGGPVPKLVHVADTRDMSPGVAKWIADVYNENLLLFGVLVVVTMSLMGTVLGLVFDRGMSLLGIHLGKLDHHE